VKKSYHNHKTLNLYLRQQLRRIETIADRFLYEGGEFTLTDIIEEFKGIKKEKASLTFSQYFQDHIESCSKRLKFGSIQNFKVAHRKWDELFPKVLLKDVTKAHIEKLASYLVDNYNLKPNTLQKRMSNIRTVCIKACKEGMAGQLCSCHSQPGG